MRIGIDCRLWMESGVGRYIRNLVFELSKIDKTNDYVLFVNEEIQNSKLKIKNDNSKFKIVKTDVKWHTFSEQLQFPSILNKENLDLIHFPYFSVPIFYKKPFVVTVHDLTIYNYSTGKASTLPYLLYLLKRLAYKLVLTTAIKNAQKIIVPLDTVKEDVLKTFPIPLDKIVVTKEGVDEKIIDDSKPSFNQELKSQNYFLYVGNAYPHKNIDTLISAFAKLKDQIKEHDVKLFLVGRNDYFYKKLERSIEKQNISSIHFFHDTNDSRLSELYKNAISVICPSKMEGFGLIPLEAMANNCLVIASNIKAHTEVCADAAFYFDPDSSESLTQKMIEIFSLDKITKEKYLKLGIKIAKTFSWGKMARQTLSIYENCFSKK